MTPFLKTIGLLVFTMLMLVSGVNAALEGSASSPTQSSFTVYAPKGLVLMSYQGDLANCYNFTHPFRPAPRAFAPRA